MEIVISYLLRLIGRCKSRCCFQEVGGGTIQTKQPRFGKGEEEDEEELCVLSEGGSGCNIPTPSHALCLYPFCFQIYGRELNRFNLREARGSGTGEGGGCHYNGGGGGAPPLFLDGRTRTRKTDRRRRKGELIERRGDYYYKVRTQKEDGRGRISWEDEDWSRSRGGCNGGRGGVYIGRKGREERRARNRL